MTLRVKLNLLLITLLLFTNSLIAYLLIEKQKEVLSNKIVQQADVISTLISQDAIKLIVLNDPDSATDISEKLSNIHTLAKIMLYDTNDKAIFKLQNQRHYGETRLITKKSPLLYKGTELGSVELFFSKEEFYEATNALVQFLFQILLLTLLLTGVFALFIDRYFSKLLSDLNDALKTTADKQDYSIRLPDNGSDEIGKAYQHFNELVTNTEKLTNKLQDQAIHDNLTGLYNRLYIGSKLNQLIASNTAEQTHALCYFDLDKFKIINDTFGHPVGDRLLIGLSAQLKMMSQTIEGAFLARIGGDEFALLITDTSQESTYATLEQVKENVRNFSLEHQGQQFSVGISIGAVLFQAPHTDRHALFSAADTACYHAKNGGGNSISIFGINSPELRSEKAIINWVLRIRSAIIQHNLLVYLQPIVHSNPAHPKKPSYEALIRLQEETELIPPLDFIPTLERFQMMPEIDFYMVNEVAKCLQNSPDFLQEVEHISINLSGITLAVPDAAQNILAILENAQIPLNKICFEITETTAISNLKEAKIFIEQLSEKGCVFSLDDFGTGMASFEYLYTLPLNYLKIDGSFIKGIDRDPVKFEMVKAMKIIADLMKLETIAEFVENQEIINKLDEIGIDYHQGYFYSQPKPIREFIEFSSN